MGQYLIIIHYLYLTNSIYYYHTLTMPEHTLHSFILILLYLFFIPYLHILAIILQSIYPTLLITQQQHSLLFHIQHTICILYLLYPHHIQRPHTHTHLHHHHHLIIKTNQHPTLIHLQQHMNLNVLTLYTLLHQYPPQAYLVHDPSPLQLILVQYIVRGIEHVPSIKHHTLTPEPVGSKCVYHTLLCLLLYHNLIFILL